MFAVSSKYPSKPVIFAEVGYFSQEAVATAPWNYYLNPGRPNEMAQANLYEAFLKVSAAYFDQPTRAREMREITPYMLEQAWFFQFPGALSYTFWTPWLKNYHGETQVGFSQSYNWTYYPWLDLDMKEEMTGKR